MKYELDGISYDVVIEKKNNKNLYIRVKEDGKIYVTCNYLTTKNMILKVLNENTKALQKMVKRIEKQNEKSNKFFYLGNSYDIIIREDTKKVLIADDEIYTKDINMLEKWKKEEIIRIFDERYVYVFNHFKENIKSPILKIRNMKTRWGVYNRKNHTITLNSKLIEYDISKIDYVIIHELSHIIHFDHSKNFWNLVSKYCKDYKKIRKEMKE
ncbi:MAG: M48 family metallopeptidase [Firmicutes bacterium]|nr:M48 family metallopeptidase [Bacillota bacterium]